MFTKEDGITLIMKTENNFKKEKMSKFTQLFNF